MDFRSFDNGLKQLYKYDFLQECLFNVCLTVSRAVAMEWAPVELLKEFLYLFIWFYSLRPINNLSFKQRRVFLGWTSTKLGEMCLAQGQQRSDACEARTRGPSASSQALYHWGTALP